MTCLADGLTGVYDDEFTTPLCSRELILFFISSPVPEVCRYPAGIPDQCQGYAGTPQQVYPDQCQGYAGTMQVYPDQWPEVCRCPAAIPSPVPGICTYPAGIL